MDITLFFKWLKTRGVREWMLLLLTVAFVANGWRWLSTAMADEVEFTVSTACDNPQVLAIDFAAMMADVADIELLQEDIQQQRRAYSCLDNKIQDNNVRRIGYWFWNESAWLAKAATDDEVEWVREYGFSPEQCLAQFQRQYCILRNYGQEAIKGMATATTPMQQEQWRDQFNGVIAALQGDIQADVLPVPAQPASHILNTWVVERTGGYGSREMFVNPTPMTIVESATDEQE